MSQKLISRSLFVSLFALVPALTPAFAQRRPVNYDEAKVGSYRLPDPLTAANGSKVTSAHAWRTKRRAEVLELFRTHVYGKSPGRPKSLWFELTQNDPNALGGKATRREITIHFSEGKEGPRLHLLLYVPNGARKPVPVFLGTNFNGNHEISTDPGITIRERWRWNKQLKRDTLVLPADSTRGTSDESWPVERLLERGYALATIPRDDIEPDYQEGWKRGIRGYYLQQVERSEFASDDWGAIAAWSWALSRALDYLGTDRDVDAKRVAVMGHSRLGKAALWSGAQDERFALVISNNSGGSGAKLSRRWFGETVAEVNIRFPHWFPANYKKYMDRESELPIDQHELIALMAPRPVYVASAEEDNWTDQRGEFLSAKHAEPVYKLYGKKGLGVVDMPPVNQRVGETIGYHIRSGKHNVTDYDWEQWMNFADRHFGLKKIDTK